MEVDGGGVHGNHDVGDDDDDGGDAPLVPDQGEGDHVVGDVGGQEGHDEGEEVGDDDESAAAYDDDGDGDDVHACPSCDNDGGIPSLVVDQLTAQLVALVHHQLDYGKS